MQTFFTSLLMLVMGIIIWRLRTKLDQERSNGRYVMPIPLSWKYPSYIRVPGRLEAKIITGRIDDQNIFFEISFYADRKYFNYQVDALTIEASIPSRNKIFYKNVGGTEETFERKGSPINLSARIELPYEKGEEESLVVVRVCNFWTKAEMFSFEIHRI